MKPYESLFKLYRDQDLATVFAHVYAISGDYNEPFRLIAKQTMDGPDAWRVAFTTQRDKGRKASDS